MSNYKICYAFLVTDIINNEESWYNYFNSNNEDFELLIHFAHSNESKHLSKLTSNIYVNKVPSKWAKLLEVELFLMEEAIKLNCDKIIFLSHSCLPVKPSAYIHKYLSNTNSYIYYNEPTDGQWDRYPARHSFTKAHQQWCILDKQHFKLFLEHPLRNYFENQVTFPEESYFASILNEKGLLSEKDCKLEMTTFVDWTRDPGHPGPYFFSNYNDYDYNIMRTAKETSHNLFIRKMSNNLDSKLIELIHNK